MERGKRSKFFVLAEFLSYREIALFFLFFFFLMVILFPRGRIEELLLSPEETNVDLSKRYLEALIRTRSPAHLKEALLRKFAQVGSEEEVKRVIEEVKKENPLLALEVEYDLLKREYFSKKQGRKEIRERMRAVLEKLITLDENPDRLRVWFWESVRMNFPGLAFVAAQKLARLTNSPEWYEEAFLYAVYSGRYEEAKRFVGKFKPKKRESYLLLYSYLLEEKNYTQALRLLTEYINRYPEEREKLRRELLTVLFLTGMFREGEKMLEELAKRPEEKKHLVLYVVKKLVELGAYAQAKVVIERYLSLFRGDRKALTEILKLSLRTGDPYFAAKVAEKILKEE